MSSSDKCSGSPRLPRIGQMVEYHSPAGSPVNETKISPAVITRVWSHDLVNLTVFPDCAVLHTASSVPRAYYGGQRFGFVE